MPISAWTHAATDTSWGRDRSFPAPQGEKQSARNATLRGGRQEVRKSVCESRLGVGESCVFTWLCVTPLRPPRTRDHRTVDTTDRHGHTHTTRPLVPFRPFPFWVVVFFSCSFGELVLSPAPFVGGAAFSLLLWVKLLSSLGCCVLPLHLVGGPFSSSSWRSGDLRDFRRL